MTVGSDVRTCFATIKGIEAGLSSLTAISSEKEHKDTFKMAQQLMKEIKVDLEKQLVMIITEEPQYK